MVREGSVWRGCLNKGLKMRKNQPCGDRGKSSPSRENNKCKGCEAGTNLRVRGTERRMQSAEGRRDHMRAGRGRQ